MRSLTPPCHGTLRAVPHYPLIVRVTHWCMALTVLVLIGSGWRIYNREPVVDFISSFPVWATLGGERSHSQAINNDGGFANALMWHFSAMWLLIANFGLYVVHGLVSRRFWRLWLPVTPGAISRDAIAAVTFRLEHRPGRCNAVQKVLYIFVVFAILMTIVSGAAIWKPVQLWWLTVWFGGFESARLVHFLCMAGIVLFIAVHVLMALLVPRTIRAMITGRTTAPVPGGTAL